MKGYFYFVRALFLQKISFYGMSGIENRTRDKVFMRMFYLGMQSQGSKSEGERSVRQRGRVECYHTGQSFKKKHSLYLPK